MLAFLPRRESCIVVLACFGLLSGCRKSPRTDVAMVAPAPTRNLDTLTVNDESKLESEFAGKPAALVLDRFKLGLKDIQIAEEPPGIWSGFYVDLSKGKESKWIVFHVETRITLWDIDVIRAAKLSHVSILHLPAPDAAAEHDP